MPRRARTSSLVVLLVGLALACGGVRPAIGAASPDDPVTLAPGETARVAAGALTLRFDDVVNDSRCPSNERCIRAGSAEIAITVTGAGEPASFTLTAGGEPSEVDYESHVVALVALAPYPATAGAIPRADYRATFRITSAR